MYNTISINICIVHCYGKVYKKTVSDCWRPVRIIIQTMELLTTCLHCIKIHYLVVVGRKNIGWNRNCWFQQMYFSMVRCNLRQNYTVMFDLLPWNNLNKKTKQWRRHFVRVNNLGREVKRVSSNLDIVNMEFDISFC